MARYGPGKETLDKEIAEIQAARAKREGLTASEVKYGEVVKENTALETGATEAERLRNQAKREGTEVSRREDAVSGRVAKNVQLETDAIERNTAARRRNQTLREQAARRATPARVVAGARDPAFSQAFALADDGNVTQYRIRQQLENVGSRRAAALQAAVQSGRFRPAGEVQGTTRPLTRQTAAELEVERSEGALAQANRTLANTRRRSTATDEDRLLALASRDAAKAQRDAANIELQSARSDAAARVHNAAALRDEAVAHARAAEAATVGGAQTQRLIEKMAAETYGTSGGHQLWWEKGDHGRGIVEPSGRVTTAAESEYTHSQLARARGITGQSYSEFFIDPQGRTRVKQPPTWEGKGAYPDEVTQYHVSRVDPRLKYTPDPARFERELEAARKEDVTGGQLGRHVDALRASIDRETTAHQANAEAVRRETVARGRPNRLPVLHPDPAVRAAYQSPVDYSDAEKRAAGQYITPTPVRETGVGAPFLHGDNEAYNARYATRQTATAARLQEQTEKTQQATRATEELTQARSAEQDAIAARNAVRVQDILGNESAATLRLNRATQESAVNYGTLSNAMRRHGALTTEFIAAAARGETTLRELGNQSLATIGKFAGWTAAASAVYGVVGAIGQLAKGALDAASGVSELDRYVRPGGELPGGAQERQKRFADLAQKYNVPISDVVQATAGTAKLFGGDLPAAFKAAESALAAMKVGELDAGDATLALNAIVNGFKLNANDLSGVLDAVNQSQQRFGGNTADLVKGVGKASGAFRNAGGDYRQLIAILTTGTRIGAGTAENVATAVQRAVSTSLTPQGQERLKSAGLNPNQTFPEIFAQAQRKAQSATPEQVNLLARSLIPAGGQFARIFVPLLQNKQLYDRVFAELAPDKAAGSTTRELTAVKDKTSEQLKAIGVNLQALGASLAESGAFTSLGIMLKVLNQILRTADDLVGVFNTLPTGVRVFGSMAAEAAVLLAVLRRIGATDKLGGSLGFLASPDKRLQKFATSGLRQATTVAKGELESQALRESRLGLEAEVARTQATHFAASSGFRDTRALGPDDEARRAADAKLVQLDAAAQRAETEHLEAAQKTQLLKESVLAHEQTLLEIENATAATIRERLTALGVAIPASLEVQNLEGIQRYGAPPARPALASEAPVALASEAAVTSTAVTYAASRAEQQAAHEALLREGAARDLALRGRTAPAPRTDFTGFVGGSHNLEAPTNRLGAEVGRLGVTGRAVTAAGTRVASVSRTAANFIGSAASGLRSAGTGLRGLAAGLGPLDLALIAFIGAEVVGSQLQKLDNDLDSSKKFLDNFNVKSKAQRDKLAQKAREANKPDDITGNYLRDTGALIGNFLTHPIKTIEGVGSGNDPGSTREKNNARTLALQRAQDRREREQQRDAAAGVPRHQLIASDLVQDINQTATERRHGLVGLTEFDRRLAIYTQEARLLLQPTKVELERVKGALASAQSEGSAQGYAQSLRGLKPEGLAAEMQRVATQIKSYGGNSSLLNRLRAGYEETARTLGDSSNADDIKALADARDLFFSTQQDSSEEEIKQGLRSADSEAARQSVFQRQIARARGAVSDISNKYSTASDSLAAARDRRDKAQAALAQSPVVLGPDPDGPPTTLGQFPRTNASALRADAERTAREVRTFSRDKRAFKRELAAAKRRLAEIEASLVDEAYSDREAGRSASAAYKASMTTDPLAKQAIEVQRAAAQAGDAAKTYGQHSRNNTEALTALNEARAAQNEQVAQDAQEHARLVGELASARAGGDPVATAQAGIAAARAAMGAARRPNERLQALIDLTNANNALQQALTEREDSRYDLLASRTEDPVVQARIARQRASYDLAHATGPTDKLQKRAAYNRSVQDYRNTRVQDQRDDIDFQLQMGKISTDTAAELIKTLSKTKNLSKKTRRDLLLEAKRLRDETSGDFELNLDSLKLPTLYEIRRAVVGGRQGMSITNQYRTNINVSDSQSALAVGQQMEKYHAGALRAVSRATGRR